MSRWRELSLRARVALELLVLGLCAAAFLLLFSERTIVLDLAMALLGLTLLGLNARYTREVIWERRRAPAKSSAGLAGPTALAVLVFLAVGAGLAYRSGGWSAVPSRLFRAQMLAAFGFYLLWALIQQTLFQFYLLGRLKRLLPALSIPALCALNGLAFAAAHWPAPALMALTAVAGAAWSYSYHENGRLWPVAVSHAALGSTFYYWVYGRDLATVWLRLIAR